MIKTAVLVGWRRCILRADNHAPPGLHAIEVAPNIAPRSTVPDAADAAHSSLHITLHLITFRFHTQPHKCLHYGSQ
jgi:hypothetical protein